MHQQHVGTVLLCVSGEPVYEACRTKVEKFLYRKLLKVSEATNMDFYGLGYFYIRAVDLGFISMQLMLMLTPCYFD